MYTCRSLVTKRLIFDELQSWPFVQAADPSCCSCHPAQALPCSLQLAKG